jgi:hypothetical protein
MYAEVYSQCNTNVTRFWGNKGTFTASTGTPATDWTATAPFNRITWTTSAPNPAVANDTIAVPAANNAGTVDQLFQSAPRNNIGPSSSWNVFPATTNLGGCNPVLAQTPHAGGMLVCLGDASVRSVASSLALTTWRRVICPADGQVLPSDW